MVSRVRKTLSGYGASLCLVYAMLTGVLFGNQALDFPLGSEDQEAVCDALGKGGEGPSQSWIAASLDPAVAKLVPRNPYPLLQALRRFAATLTLVGIAVWAWRSLGWTTGIWVAVLGLGFMPLRIVSGTLAPQTFCLALLVWGGLLSLGKPWSKTGTAEQVGGGFLLGLACFAAPWGFLYAFAIPIHALLDARFRKRLEATFWISFAIGLLPGVCWLVLGTTGKGYDLGFRPESIGWAKFEQVLELAGGSPGWFFAVSIAIGLYSSLRSKRNEDSVCAIDLAWPAVPSLLLGYAHAIHASLAFPGLVFLSALGFQYVGRTFASKTEQKLIPTLLVLLLGYHAFFSGLPAIRERQSHSLEVASLAQLIVERVPPGDPVALFRLESVLDYLNALLPETEWTAVRKTDFPPEARNACFVLFDRFQGRRSLWIDRKRAAEPEAGLGGKYVDTLFESARTEFYHGGHSAELVRVRLGSFRANRGKRTAPQPIPSPMR